MSQELRIERIHPKDLTTQDAERWSAIRASRPELSGPYFDIRYIQSIAAAVPGCGVVRIHSAERIVGYFAWQKRGDVLLPMGAPLSDYHGPITEPGIEVDIDAVLKATGTRRLEFQGWIGPVKGAKTQALSRRLADASQGYDAWWATQDAAHHKFFKNISRCQRNVDKDFGGFVFSWERVTPELMDWVIGLKREQYRRTGMHDVFDCGWTRSLLDQLAATPDDDFGLRAGVFRHDGRLVAVEIGLVQGEEVHLWFPAYDCDYSRYSVGILLTMAIIKNTESLGLKRFDFGTGGEDYKSPMTTAGGSCYEGEIALSPRLTSRVLDVAAVVMPRERFAHVRQSLRRRVKVIRATEVGLVGWGRAALSLMQRACMRLGESRAYVSFMKKSAGVMPICFIL